MTTPFLKALENISQLCKQADVVGRPRISITFDTGADRERFIVEMTRQLRASGVLNNIYSEPMQATNGCAFGIDYRIV